MARGILWIVLAVFVLLLAGCSSHPPSAAAFMNMKENGASVVVGATARVGDNHEEGRDDNDYIHREGYWNLDISMLGRFFNLVMTGVTLENYTPRRYIGSACSICRIAGMGWRSDNTCLWRQCFCWWGDAD